MKKLLSKIFNKLNWDRINPWILNANLITFLSLKKIIINFSNKYIKKWDKILDFWCWNMVYKKFFENKNINKYVWIDIWESPEFNDNYIVYWWWKTPFNDNEFDVIISTQVFEHLENPNFYWQELERITKNWWYLFISIAHVWEYHAYPKHYFNFFYDAIPVIFKNCKIIDIKWDTTNIQNSMQILLVSIIKKFTFFWLFLIMIYNLFIKFLIFLKLYKIWDVEYKSNSLTWNIIVILKVNKS